VAALRADPKSILYLYRRLIALRRSQPALVSGAYVPAACRGEVLGYWRVCETQTLGILLNFCDAEQPVSLPRRGRVLISTYLDRDDDVSGPLTLRPHEGVLFEQEAGAPAG
jgi:alpha-glucosidase